MHEQLVRLAHAPPLKHLAASQNCGCKWNPAHLLRSRTSWHSSRPHRCRAAVCTAVPTPQAPASAAPSPSTHQQGRRLGVDIPVELRSVRVGTEHEFLLLLPELEAVMDMYISAGQADRDPYWCEPWPSALVMAQELLHRPGLVAGKRVAELGCGLGLAGLAAAAAGAAEVVMLDREPLALQCALLNAQLNGLSVGTLLPAEWASSEAVQQLAALELDLEALLSHLTPEEQQRVAERRASHAATSSSSSSSSGGSSARSGTVSAAEFDWSQPVTLAPSDVLLACDVLYESFSVQPVAGVAPLLLKKGGDARLLLADPPNRARHNRECFLDLLTEDEASAEFVVEESEELNVRVWGDPTPDGSSQPSWREVPIALMILRRAAGGDTVGVKLRRRE